MKNEINARTRTIGARWTAWTVAASGFIVASALGCAGESGPPADLADDVEQKNSELAGRLYEHLRWPGFVLPYEVDAVAFPPGSQTRIDILAGLQQWYDTPGFPITFVQHTPGSGGDYVKFVQSTSIRSEFIGRKGGEQLIYISPAPGAFAVAHEIGHAMGLYHEQQRADRRSYIFVYDGTDGFADRLSACGGPLDSYRRYFDVALANQPAYGPDGVDLGTFDFSSIMLYPPLAWSCCPPAVACPGMPTMTKTDGTTWTQGTVATAQDGAAIRRLYFSFTDGTSPVGSGQTCASLSSWGGTRQDLVARRASDGNMVHAYNNGAGWSGWVDNWGGAANLSINSHLRAVSWGVNRIDVVTNGKDNNVWHFWYQNGFTAWESLGGGPVSAATVSSQGFGMLDVFAIKTTDGKIYRRSYTNANGWGSWTAVTSTGGFTTAKGHPLDAVSWGPGRIDVVGVKSTGASLWHAWSGNGGSTWGTETLIDAANTGSNITSATVASFGLGRLDVFYGHGSDVLRKSFEGGWGGPMYVTSSTGGGAGRAVGRRFNNDDIIDMVYSRQNPVTVAGGDFWLTEALR